MATDTDLPGNPSIPPGSSEGERSIKRGAAPVNGGAFTFNNRHLRFIFVGFLFSFVIREIASVAYQLWPPSTASHAVGATHLVLALFATTMSWVYWARNINTDSTPLDDAFSLQFFLLLMDLALVILYYALVSSAEHPDPITRNFGELSAVPESSILVGVYALYVGWDVIHDVIEKKSGTTSVGLCGLAKATLVRTFASIICLLLAFGVVGVAVRCRIDQPIASVFLNVAEFANLWLFRALKLGETVFEKYLDARFGQPDRFRHKTVMKCVGVGSLVLYVVCIVMAIYTDRSLEHYEICPVSSETR